MRMAGGEYELFENIKAKLFWAFISQKYIFPLWLIIIFSIKFFFNNTSIGIHYWQIQLFFPLFIIILIITFIY